MSECYDQPSVAAAGAPLKKTVSAWQRWEMAAFQAPPEPAPANAEPALEQFQPALLIDEAELTRLRQEAHQAGAEEGRQLGYLEGQKQGYAAGSALAAGELAQLSALAAALPAALRNADREIADVLLTLALDIARQLVLQELAADPEVILAAVRALLQTEPALCGSPRLFMHPEDLALVQHYLADDLHAAGWLLRADPSLNRGGCRVHAGSGEIDATLETRWQRVTAALGRNEAGSGRLLPPAHG